MQKLITARSFYDAGKWRDAEEAYRRVLLPDPQNGEALERLGLLALNRTDPAAAAEYLQKAAALGSRDAMLHNHLGVARAMLKQFEEAAASFRQAVALSPGWADPYYNCGNSLSSLGRLDEAIEQYRAAAARKPESAEIQYNLANTLRDAGRLDDSLSAYRQALRLKPDHLKAYNNLGNVLRDQGKLGEAVDTYRAALAIKPNYAQGRHNLGVALLLQNHAEQAIQELREALRIKPDLVGARASLGKALVEQGRLDEALPLLQSAQSQGESNVEVQLMLAERLRKEGRFDEAITCVQAVIEARADSAAAHNNLGLLWFNKQDFPQAIECYRQAIQIKPDFAEAHNNLAITLLIMGDLEAGLAAVHVALRIKPDFAIAHLNRAVAWLRMGRFETGWHEFEWRRLCDKHHIAPLPAPLWDGSPLPERCLLLNCEQGLGDTIQFIRYAPLVKKRCGRLIMQCQPGMVPLLSRCPGVDQLIVRGELLPEYHVHAPLMSLPDILGTRLETIPAEVPYVFADEELVKTWRQRLAAYPGFKVGIGWQGNKSYFGDNLRSVPLRHFACLARVPDVKLLSLQKGAGVEQLASRAKGSGPCFRAEFLGEFDPSSPKNGPDPDFPVIDLAAEFGADFDATGRTFMDTAAVMRNLDLVIASDSAVVHLAGSLGVPVWVALNTACDWRWLDEREDSPWYPTMRLFRQKRQGEWDEVFARIGEELARLVRRESDGKAAGGRRRAEVGRQKAAILTPLAPGELLDKISILEIKRQRVSDARKLANICRELEMLREAKEDALTASSLLIGLYAQLGEVNRRLWEIEDLIRGCEARGDFGPKFVELARSVYRTNDERTALKRRINEASGSELKEEKVYESYE